MTGKNVVLMAAGGIIAVLVLISVFLLYRGFRDFRKAEGVLNRAVTELRGYYAKDPFPSGQNVSRIKDNAKTLGDWLDRLMDGLRTGQIEPDSKTPGTFMALLNGKRIGLQKAAKQSGTGLPENFAFGFERYEKGTPPVPPDVARLTQQLTMVENICAVLFAEKANH